MLIIRSVAVMSQAMPPYTNLTMLAGGGGKPLASEESQWLELYMG